ncbi:hypothetical protein I302_103172 [Kwoniella bestiolae CBS 10118]|uniref:Uncharacterized protein n=1 Tax=Kwoniella bestiolae CBS 10118 TaxID=1296100 RepID=A0A1B9G7M7_9TREE|nr:hypothetical protein I302_01870 [Kwoniella bestiolae CBS 10118]OCF27035.1 hypothetical protein I302_01870 [Kwoniella bestiolae CBS 10118]
MEFRRCVPNSRPRLKKVIGQLSLAGTEEVDRDNFKRICAKLLHERQEQNRLGKDRAATMRELALQEDYDIRLLRIDFLDHRKRQGRKSPFRSYGDDRLLVDVPSGQNHKRNRWNDRIWCVQKEVDNLVRGNQNLMEDINILSSMLKARCGRSANHQVNRERSPPSDSWAWLQRIRKLRSKRLKVREAERNVEYRWTSWDQGDEMGEQGSDCDTTAGPITIGFK